MRHNAALDPAGDPFRERSPMPWRTKIALLGGRFHFESNSRQLLRLVEAAYAGLPRHLFARDGAPFRIRLRLTQRNPLRTRAEPPSLTTLSGPGGLLCAVMDAANFALLSPNERAALVVVSSDMLASRYHARYELIEFSVFTLACRAQGLVSLHAACVGHAGRGLLLMGSSGAGKSTLALHCLLQGMDFLSEDAVFVRPDPLIATAVPNFLYVRRDSLRELDDLAMVARIRKSPIIRRRSGVEKFEVDLRPLECRLSAAPLAIEGVVFLGTRRAGSSATVLPLPNRELITRLRVAQPYATQLPSWKAFKQNLAGIRGFELQRGQHPAESAVALRHILEQAGRVNPRTR
jgi:hypothetical protein